MGISQADVDALMAAVQDSADGARPAAELETGGEKAAVDPSRDREGAAFAASTGRFLGGAALKSASHPHAESTGSTGSLPAPPRPGTSATPSPKSSAIELKRILTLSVPVIVELAHQEMPVRKILDFKLGSIIEFDKAFDADLALVVGNRCIGMGQAVKVGENFGLRITRIGKVGDTIRALGGA